jgi:NAD(P)-dependent dehydrogenase (short-subunit alcohol dehydrogenase family)
MNPMNATPALRVLLVDADEPLGFALAGELRATGHHVITHARNASAPTDVHAGDLTTDLETVVAQHGPFDRVVFGLRSGSEQFEAPEDLLRAQHDLGRSLGELRAVAQMEGRREQGQVWQLLPEDSMQYYLDVPSQPVRSRALMAAVKSLAKEVFRFGVRINALQVQPLAEQLPASEWRAAREGLKAYALKFKPQPCIEVARLIHGLLAQPNLPLAGLVLPVGVGFPETNV